MSKLSGAAPRSERRNSPAAKMTRPMAPRSPALIRSARRPAMGAAIPTAMGQGVIRESRGEDCPAKHRLEQEWNRHIGEHLGRKRHHRRRDRKCEDRDFQQVEGHQWVGCTPFAPDQPGSCPEPGDDHQYRKLVTLTRHVFSAEYDQSHHRAAQNRRTPIEWPPVPVRVRKSLAADDQRSDSDWQVDEEQPLPRCNAEDDGGERRADRGRHRQYHRIIADSPAKHLRRIGRTHERRVHAHDAGGADALEHARGNQQGQRSPGRAAHRTKRKQHQPRDVDAFVADPIAKCCERQQKDGDRQLIRVDHPDRRCGRRAELMGDDRQRDVGDCSVEHRHGERQPNADDGPISPRDRQAVLLVMVGRGLEVHGRRLIGRMANELQPMRMPVLDAETAVWPGFSGRGSGRPTGEGWRSSRASLPRRP